MISRTIIHAIGTKWRYKVYFNGREKTEPEADLISILYPSFDQARDKLKQYQEQYNGSEQEPEQPEPDQLTMFQKKEKEKTPTEILAEMPVKEPDDKNYDIDDVPF